MNSQPTVIDSTIIDSQAMLEHWQGHRRLTRRVIEAFPEKELFQFSVGGMRPFAVLALEMIDIGTPGIVGMVTDDWKSGERSTPDPKSKAELLRYWDEVTEQIDTLWPRIAPGRFSEVALAFGLYHQPVYATLMYFIDNEIHHRGQGYVYLRVLGIEPPAFWERN